MYAVTAVVETKSAPWTSTRQIPTFFLDENVQGIRTEKGAKKIALDVLDPTGNLRDSPYHTFHISAVRV